MISDDPVLQDLRTLYSGGRGQCGLYGDAGSETITHWSKKLQKSKSATLNDLATEVANGFLAGSVDWQFGDWIANTVLFCGMTDFRLDEGTEQKIERWWSVYLAFDNSEITQCQQTLERDLEEIVTN